MGRNGRWLVVGMLVAAAALRLFQLDARSMWFDEALSALIGHLTFRQVLTGVAGSSHPPLYYLFLQAWQKVGEGDWLLRFPSVLMSLLAVAMCYRVGSLMFDRRAGLIGAAGMALSPLQVYYAQEARMYALATVLALGMTWCFICGSRRPRSTTAWIGYTLFSALGLYTHYFVAWLLLVFPLWLLAARHRSRDLWLSLLVADLVVGLLFLPQAGQLLREAGEFMGKDWRQPPNPLVMLALPEYLLFGHTVLERWWWGLRTAAVVLLMGFVVLEWRYRRSREWRQWAGFSLLAVTVPVLLVVAISWLFQPLYLARSFEMFAPFLVLFLAQGAASASRFSPTPWIGLLLGLLLLAGTVFSLTQPDVAKPPVREAMAVVAADFRPGDLSLHLDETYLSALFYEPDLLPALLDAGQLPWAQPDITRLLGGRVFSLEEVLAAEGRLWLVVTDRSRQPWEPFLEMVGRERELDGAWNWGDLDLYRYRRD